MKKSLLFVVPLVCGGVALPMPAAAAEAVPVALLVRVVELSAVGPDGGHYTLYHDTAGAVATWRGLGSVVYLVKAGTLPEGGYHTLSVRLADEVTAIYAGGRRERVTLAARRLAAERRISGMLWIEGGEVRTMRPFSRAGLRHGRHGHGGDDD